MRIIQVAQAITPTYNGQAVFMTNLARGLVQAGHEVTVIVASDKCNSYKASIHGVHIQNIRSIPLYIKNLRMNIAINPTLEILRSFQSIQPDILHFQDHYQVSRAAIRIALKANLPTIGTNHFLPENALPYVTTFRCLWPYLTGFEWNTLLDVYNKLNLVVSPTKTAQNILRSHKLTSPATVISSGVNLERFYRDPQLKRNAVLQKYGLGKNEIVLLYVGRLDYEKRLDTLLRAVSIAKNRNVRLVLVGGGGFTRPIKSLVKSMHLDNQVIFTGNLPHPELFELLNASDVFVMPSDAELQSIATLEAMATGLPILAANAKALPELVEDGVNGWLFRAQDSIDAAEKIMQIVGNYKKCKVFGEASLSKVRKHALPETINKYLVAYSGLVTARKQLFCPNEHV